MSATTAEIQIISPNFKQFRGFSVDNSQFLTPCNTQAGGAKFTPNLGKYVKLNNLFSDFENINFRLQNKRFSTE